MLGQTAKCGCEVVGRLGEVAGKLGAQVLEHAEPRTDRTHPAQIRAVRRGPRSRLAVGWGVGGTATGGVRT